MKAGTLFRVEGIQIKSIDDTKLIQLVDRLLQAEAFRVGVPPSEAYAGSDKTTADDGLDAYSPRHSGDDEFMPQVETCWQLKAGKQGQRGKVAPKGQPTKSELAKPIPTQVLLGGGAFVLVASDAADAKKGITDRRAALVDSARGLGLPDDKIYVMGADKLARWCSVHPSVAAPMSRLPSSVFSFLYPVALVVVHP